MNVRAPFFIIQQALPLTADGGRIVNISSAVNRVAMPEVAYPMTKGAIDVLGRTVAHAFADRGITLNTVAPGVTDSDRNAWLAHLPEAKAGVEHATRWVASASPRTSSARWRSWPPTTPAA